MSLVPEEISTEETLEKVRVELHQLNINFSSLMVLMSQLVDTDRHAWRVHTAGSAEVLSMPIEAKAA